MPDGGRIGKADDIHPAGPQKKGGQCDRPDQDRAWEEESRSD
jgi:hypothetical protein